MSVRKVGKGAIELTLGPHVYRIQFAAADTSSCLWDVSRVDGKPMTKRDRDAIEALGVLVPENGR